MQGVQLPRIFLMVLLTFVGVLCGAAVAGTLSEHSTPMVFAGGIIGAVVAACAGIAYNRMTTPAGR
jgi:hypothetical protein